MDDQSNKYVIAAEICQLFNIKKMHLAAISKNPKYGFPVGEKQYTSTARLYKLKEITEWRRNCGFEKITQEVSALPPIPRKVVNPEPARKMDFAAFLLFMTGKSTMPPMDKPRNTKVVHVTERDINDFPHTAMPIADLCNPCPNYNISLNVGIGNND